MSTQLFDLTGKIALVSGASRGIGEEIAKLLAEQAVQNIPMARHAEPSEMAGTVLYLVSDASSYTNGACIVVDGGLTL